MLMQVVDLWGCNAKAFHPRFLHGSTRKINKKKGVYPYVVFIKTEKIMYERCIIVKRNTQTKGYLQGRNYIVYNIYSEFWRLGTNFLITKNLIFND